MQRLALFLTGFVLALAPRPATADIPGPGYQVSTAPNPSFASVTCTLAGGDIVTFDGTTVDRWSPSGFFLFNLHTFPSFVYPSFVLPTPDGLGVVVGENLNGEIWNIAVNGTGGSLVATLVLNYDAAFAASGDLIVSAATGGFGTGNDLVRVDLSPPSATPIGHVAGASGPLAIKLNGDLYYATASSSFPAPPGSTDVLFWTAAQVGGGALSNANAATFATGFDNGASMRFDPVGKKLYMAEVDAGTGSNRVLKVGATRALSQLVARAPAGQFISNLEFVNAGGPASFGAYQPSNGSNLKYNTTDFMSTSAQALVKPLRPTLVASGAGTTGPGPISLTLSGGVPDGSAYLVFCPQNLIAPTESVFAFPGFLFHSGFTLSAIRRTPFLVPTDSNGDALFQIFNPGDLQGLFGFQFFIGDDAGTFVGSSNSVQF